jgi:hypothetical protein
MLGDCWGRSNSWGGQPLKDELASTTDNMQIKTYFQVCGPLPHLFSSAASLQKIVWSLLLR